MDKVTTQTAIQTLQLIVLIVGIGAAVVTVGRRDAEIGRNIQDIAELRKISVDLMRTSISHQMADEYQNRQLMELLARIERLES